MHLMQTGMWRKININNLLWSEQDKYKSDDDEDIQLLRIGFSNVVFPFMAVAFGIGLSIVIIFLEMIIIKLQ